MRADFGNVAPGTLDGLVIALPGSSHPGGAPVDIVMECGGWGPGSPNVKLLSRYLDLESGATASEMVPSSASA